MIPENLELKLQAMDADKIVVYQSYLDPINANIVKGLLDSYGIECFLTDENMVTLNAMYSSAVGGVKLHIFEKDAERISAILQSENTSPEMTTESENQESEITCPKCSSANIAWGGSVNKKFGFWNVFLMSLITVFFFLSYPFNARKTYRCFDCDHEFKKT